MSAVSHFFVPKVFAILLIFSSILGWNISEGQVPAPTLPVVATSPQPATKIPIRTDKSAVTTKIASGTIPYLKIIAPEFAQIPLESVPNIHPTALPPLPEIPSPAEPIQQPVQTIQASSTTVLASNPDDAVINIFCTYQKGNYLSYITGSGVVIDQKGVILTNSHVAQYVLLADYLNNKLHTCVGRVGTPARNAYTLKVLYISSAWINSNNQDMSEANPTGTGQSDYALLVITGSSDKNSLSQFPSLPLSKQNVLIGDQVTVLGYPAGSLDPVSVKTNLQRLSDRTSIKATYAFDNSGVSDLITTGGTLVAQRGSSGGAVIGNDNILQGIITTSIADPSTGSRSLSAITTNYIDKDLQNHIGQGIESLLSGDVRTNADIFEQTIGAGLAQTLATLNSN